MQKLSEMPTGPLLISFTSNLNNELEYDKLCKTVYIVCTCMAWMCMHIIKK